VVVVVMVGAVVGVGVRRTRPAGESHCKCDNASMTFFDLPYKISEPSQARSAKLHKIA